jgi:flagellar biosynthesis/type III secretory pathway protein FliH
MQAAKKVLIPWAVLALVISLGGCAKPPTEEMAAATEALIRAENDPDAAAYGETSLNRARDAIFRMRQEANAKRYDAAKSYAAEAISAAEKAISDGRIGAQRARDEAASLVATVKNSLVETQNSLDNAKRTGLDLDYRSLDQDRA